MLVGLKVDQQIFARFNNDAFNLLDWFSYFKSRDKVWWMDSKFDKISAFISDLDSMGCFKRNFNIDVSAPVGL